MNLKLNVNWIEIDIELESSKILGKPNILRFWQILELISRSVEELRSSKNPRLPKHVEISLQLIQNPFKGFRFS